MLYETCTAHRPPKSPPAATEWPRLLLRDVIWSEREPFRRCRGWCCCMTQQFSVFCPWRPWPLTFDLALQAPQSEGSNTSSMWIWRKSVQRFPRYFIHKQKTQTDGATNRTFRSSLHAVIKRWLLRTLSGTRLPLICWSTGSKSQRTSRIGEPMLPAHDRRGPSLLLAALRRNQMPTIETTLTDFVCPWY